MSVFDYLRGRQKAFLAEFFSIYLNGPNVNSAKYFVWCLVYPTFITLFYPLKTLSPSYLSSLS